MKKSKSWPLYKPPTPSEKALTTGERNTFRLCESTIKKGLRSFMAVGKALALISEKRLYRGNYNSFEEYMQSRWGIGARQGQRLMNAVEIASNLQGLPAPTSESQVRPLRGLPREKQREVWVEATRTAPEGKVTAKHVANVRGQKLLPTPHSSLSTFNKPSTERNIHDQNHSTLNVESKANNAAPGAGEKEASSYDHSISKSENSKACPSPGAATDSRYPLVIGKDLVKAAGHAIEAVRDLIDLAGPVEAVKSDLNSVLHKLTAFHARVHLAEQEIDVSCPYCGESNFTVTGLSHHICDQTPQARRAGRPIQLSKDQWEKAVQQAAPLRS